ncbi:MAG: STAS domain-containing protein [Thermoleophilia bacterium]|nr:STAS domain-containing protein [Thermoleophilia bacterium]
MTLSLSTETLGGFVVIDVGGDLDVYTAPRLQEALDQTVSNGARVILDLTDVHFIDSTALGVLAGAHEKSKAASGELRLVVDDPHVLKIFRITGFEGIFSIYGKVADAISG